MTAYVFKHPRIFVVFGKQETKYEIWNMLQELCSLEN